MSIEIEYLEATNRFMVWILYSRLSIHHFKIEAHELPAVALTMMEIQIAQEASES